MALDSNKVDPSRFLHKDNPPRPGRKKLFKATGHYKKCASCKKNLDLCEYGKKKTHKDSLSTECRDCSAARGRENRRRKKLGLPSLREEYIKRQESKYGLPYKHPDYSYAKNISIKFGMDLLEYNKMFEKQRGCCAICGDHQSVLKHKLHIDHNHNNMKIRGLLCRPCNTAIGLLKDNTEVIREALNYVTNDGI